jgi:hypothetical protein
MDDVEGRSTPFRRWEGRVKYWNVQPVPNTKCVYLASMLSRGTDIALGELVVGPPMFTFPKNFNLESVAASSNL